jgi:hypothetical protein
VQLSVVSSLPASSAAEVRDFVKEVRAGLEASAIAPYVGPGLFPSNSLIPPTYQAVADHFGKKVALPKRARGNLWASAQYVESVKHRATAVAYMAEAFDRPSAPLSFHRFLATQPLPLIADTWYDGSLRAALQERTDWVEVQGISRAGIGESRWYRCYAPDGKELPIGAAAEAKTVLYKPIGAVTPAKNFIVSDADYVEVLTEIDIQTPIPEVVKSRRSGLGFLFLGCRFHDQTLRIYARQIVKRSQGPYFAVVDSTAGMTRNEQKFLKELGVRVVVSPLADVCAALSGA